MYAVILVQFNTNEIAAIDSMFIYYTYIYLNIYI